MIEVYENREELVKEMDEYLYDRMYNSNYGDIVLQIIANALSVNLHIAFSDECKSMIFNVDIARNEVVNNNFLYIKSEHNTAISNLFLLPSKLHSIV